MGGCGSGGRGVPQRGLPCRRPKVRHPRLHAGFRSDWSPEAGGYGVSLLRRS
uniref:Uncharacterized protein n=1 Tax=Arundo donax TaxID=35708 RepID=A0A0A9BH28_ARUDO